ncbi:MAG TPA: trehalose synthase, partial [Microbacteriaceae bacterium]|nr:trehalose synthase [Microbacteriaceae bacterium]
MSFTAPIQLPGLTLDPRWYRRSVFYEVMVRSFVDSNGDGSGDLQGLLSKLDYLQWLGVDALWLPPIYQSPLRDGGYDVADFKSILPEFGTLDEFKDLVTKAHERNMR